jgi:predicted TIM-barrel fold metal-dependent hydrolase
LPAEETLPLTPLPTQIVASDEYLPFPQTRAQRAAEARLFALADEIAPKHGWTRRRFFQSAAGMTAAFVALNEVFGRVFEASAQEARTPDMADERAAQLADQFIVDVHTHFLRDDTRLQQFAMFRTLVGQAGWNPALAGREQTLEDLKFENFRREIYLDSDTKIALISSAPSDVEQDWFLTNADMIAARTRVNEEAGSRRMMAHAIFRPGAPGWLEALDAALEARPDSVKGYTIGDATHLATSRYPWRMDDEALAYRGYEKLARAGVRNVCVHKGLWPPQLAQRVPQLTAYSDVSDVARAARDWPQLNFIIYHSGFRHIGNDPAEAWAEFEQTGRLSWVSDLADIPARHGVTNVYGDLGQIFASTLVSHPRVCAAIMGILIKGLGANRVCWGSDAVWTGSPQWQIEGLRRLEIPEDMQRAHGFAPLGPADGPVKTAIFGDNNARLYGITDTERQAWREDRLQQLKAAHRQSGGLPSNLRYGYVAPA